MMATMNLLKIFAGWLKRWMEIGGQSWVMKPANQVFICAQVGFMLKMKLFFPSSGCICEKKLFQWYAVVNFPSFCFSVPCCYCPHAVAMKKIRLRMHLKPASRQHPANWRPPCLYSSHRIAQSTLSPTPGTSAIHKHQRSRTPYTVIPHQVNFPSSLL